MPAGFQAFDGAGNLTADTTSKVLKYSEPITFTASTTGVQSIPLPPGVTKASIIARPNSGTGDARTIHSQVVGSNIQYGSRVADGRTFTLNVVLY